MSGLALGRDRAVAGQGPGAAVPVGRRDGAGTARRSPWRHRAAPSRQRAAGGCSPSSARRWYWSRRWATSPAAARHCVMVNRLSVPIGVVLGAEHERRVAPGDSSALSVPRAASLSVSWYAIGPRSGKGQAAGSDLQRTQVLDTRRRGLRIEARADSGEPTVFLPYVTNATGQPLTHPAQRRLLGGGVLPLQRACRARCACRSASTPCSATAVSARSCPMAAWRPSRALARR